MTERNIELRFNSRLALYGRRSISSTTEKLFVFTFAVTLVIGAIQQNLPCIHTSDLTDSVWPDTLSKYLHVHFALTRDMQRKHSDCPSSRTASIPREIEYGPRNRGDPERWLLSTAIFTTKNSQQRQAVGWSLNHLCFPHLTRLHPET